MYMMELQAKMQHHCNSISTKMQHCYDVASCHFDIILLPNVDITFSLVVDVDGAKLQPNPNVKIKLYAHLDVRAI